MATNLESPTDAFQTYDFSVLPARDIYRLMIGAVVPRPIAWISSCDEAGRPNLAPFSFFGAVSSAPPIVSVSITYAGSSSSGGALRKKDTLLNIEKTGQLVINIADENLAQALNQTSAEYSYGVSEFADAGVTPIASIKVRPPRVKEAPVQMECSVYEIIPVGRPQVGACTLVLAQIEVVHVGAELAAKGLENLHPLARLGKNDYGKIRENFELRRPSVPRAGDL